jgi:hypothetical protein
VRALRHLAVAFVGAALIGGLAGLLLTTLVGGGVRPAPASTRHSPPSAAMGSGGSGARVHLLALEPMALTVRVENPTAAPMGGLAVRLETGRGWCDWTEGPFPEPFGLEPGGSTERTCRVVEGDRGPFTVRATLLRSWAPVHAASLDLPGAASVPDDVETQPEAPTADEPAPERTPPPPPAEPPRAPCPRLLDPTPGGSRRAEDLGSGLVARAGGLDLVACPDWAVVAGLRAVPVDGDLGCPSWSVGLDGSDTPAVSLAVPSTPTCSAVPLEVSVTGWPTDVAAKVVTLVALALGADPAAATAIHDGARSGVGRACDGTTPVGLLSPYEQDTGAGAPVPDDPDRLLSRSGGLRPGGVRDRPTGPGHRPGCRRAATPRR